MLRKFSFYFIFSLLTSSVFAVQEFYSLSKSIRSLGMGGAFFGLSDDEYALFSNPAGLSTRRSGTEVMLRTNGAISSNAISGFKDFKDLGDLNIKQAIDRLDKYKDKPMTASAGLLPYFLTKNLAVGLLIADTKVNFNILKGSADIDNINDLDKDVADLTMISDSGLILGYGQSVIDPNLHVGVNLKGLFRAGGRQAFKGAEYINASGAIDLDPKKLGGSGMGVDLDVGATYEFKDLSFGLLSRASLVFSNLLATNFSISKKYAGAPGLARTVNLGWYTVFEGVSFIDNFHVLADLSDISLGGQENVEFGARKGDLLKRLHLGVEMPIGRVSLRAGLNQGYLSAGIGLNLYALRLDFATYGEETSNTTRRQSRRYLATVAFGWGSAPAAPVRAEAKPGKPSPVEPKSSPVPSTENGDSGLKETFEAAPKPAAPKEVAPKKSTESGKK